MASKCRFPDRNFCAPDGKIAVLFVDVDGTTSKCQPYFDGAIDEFATLMALCGFSRKLAKETLEQTYYGSMPARGFDRGKLSEAITEAYVKLCRMHKRRVRKDIKAICDRIGSAPFFRDPEMFPNAVAVLGRARHNFYLIAVTVGNREAQKWKIRQGGLDAVFDEVIVTLDENKDDVIREAIEDLNIAPEYSAHIGNSIRSDGAALTETNVIFLPLERSLSRKEDKFPEGSRFKVFHVKDWNEVEVRGITRLLRQRQQALLAEGDRDACADTPCGCGD